MILSLDYWFRKPLLTTRMEIVLYTGIMMLEEAEFHELRISMFQQIRYIPEKFL